MLPFLPLKAKNGTTSARAENVPFYFIRSSKATTQFANRDSTRAGGERRMSNR